MQTAEGFGQRRVEFRRGLVGRLVGGRDRGPVGRRVTLRARFAGCSSRGAQRLRFAHRADQAIHLALQRHVFGHSFASLTQDSTGHERICPSPRTMYL